MRIFIIAVIGLLFTIPHSANAALPTHCGSDEYAIVDAWMSHLQDQATGSRDTKNTKLVSLCADKKKEPFSKVTYRYGKVGNVEFKAVASIESPFKLAAVKMGPNAWRDLIFFSKGDYTYYVAIATGQGSGISLQVFKGKKKLVGHFSGVEEDEDFQLGPAEIDYSAARPVSLLFRLEKPKHTLD